MKEERRKERIKKRKNKQPGSGGKVPQESSIEDDYEDGDLEDKSFDSLSSFTTDVKDKVGSVGNSVTSGVTVSSTHKRLHLALRKATFGT